jgi:hypothetical protein
MENKLTTTLARSPDLEQHVPTLRTDLSRFGIFVDVPPAIAALIIDIFDQLPDADAKSFPREIALSIQPGADLSRIPALFLQWLLTDAKRGAINLSKRVDVKDAVSMVIRNVLAPKAENRPLDAIEFKRTHFFAQVTQLKTWHDYRDARAIDGIQPRIEWMIAVAANDAIQPHVPEQLISAVHSCGVAWFAAQHGSSHAEPSFKLYMAIRDRLLLELLAGQPGAAAPASHTNNFDKVGAGDRVTFDDVDAGPQTGTVMGILNSPDAPASAVVLVDHSLEGVTWNVPLAKLSPLEAEPA